MTQKRSLTVLPVLLLLLLSMAACSKKNTADVPPEVVNFEPLTEIKEGRDDIYLIVKIIDSSYWQVIITGAKQAGDDLNCNVYLGGTTIETDWKGQRGLINDALTNGAKAIVLAPDDSVELATDIEKVHDLNVPIVLIDTAANTDSYDKCYMTDNLLAGQKAAEEMLSRLKEFGHTEDEQLSVGIMAGMATSQTINERLAGFYQYWSHNAPGKWSIISDIMNCNGNIELGDQMAVNTMKKHGDLAGLFATNNGPTRAICKAVSDNERTDLIIVGFDYSDEIKGLIASPDYRASTMLQRQYDMSYRAVGTALDLLSGKAVDIRFEDTGVVTVNNQTLTDPDVVELLKNN
ncbi:MAG: substrate-binding domain-containing protein [Lachnospiraceae bacterium]|nr:substrate-binding domain-containing protein [Lachnospiraceae bacterium]